MQRLPSLMTVMRSPLYSSISGMAIPRFELQLSPKLGSNLLIVFPDFRVLAQARVEVLEHRVHLRVRHRAFGDDDERRLVRRGAHKAPGAVFERHAGAVDGDELFDLLTEHIF